MMKGWVGVGTTLALAASLGAPGAGAQTIEEMVAMAGQPVEPFRIVGDLWYVGHNGVTAFLWTGPEGHVLIDGTFPSTAASIRDNIERLGFRIEDVRVLLNSHAHFDHAGGLAALAEWSGAEVVASAGDAPVLEAGGRGDPVLGDQGAFPPVDVGRVVEDGEVVRVGPLALTAHVTAGHTPGCTTWTARIPDVDGRELDVVFVCSVTVLPDHRLTGEDASWPGIEDDFIHTFERLETLPVDIFLASHAGFFGMAAKAEIVRAGGDGTNPFIDPDRYARYVEAGRTRFEERLAAERGGGGFP